MFTEPLLCVKHCRYSNELDKVPALLRQQKNKTDSKHIDKHIILGGNTANAKKNKG